MILKNKEFLASGKRGIASTARFRGRKVLVKEGIPFVPSFLIAYLLTLWLVTGMGYSFFSFF